MKLILIMILIILFPIVINIFYELNCRPKIHILSELSNIQLETGDLLLVSTHAHHPMLLGLMQRNAFLQVIGGGGEWNHVAMIVMINNEPFVYTTCPFNPRSVAYDFTRNQQKDSGFVHLRKYVDHLHGYVGIRKLKRSFLAVNDDTFLHVMQVHNQRMKYNLDFLKCIVSSFNKHDIQQIKDGDGYNCCEAVAKIYSDVGISYEKFHVGMSLRPLVDQVNCPLFGPIIHIRPGPRMSQNLQKYFENR
jgi:hypothetical protein